MMPRRPRFKDGKAGLNIFRPAVRNLLIALFLGITASVIHAQEKELPRLPKPARIVTIQGQVSLPEGMPVGRALVTLMSGTGVPRQTYTTEQGRFEFQGIVEGSYTLSARSLNDPTLATESVETDTSRTATSNLSVNLTLRKEADARGPKAEVVTLAEAEQKVPKQARKAFREGLKFREDSQPEKALQSLSRAVELYPEYFQALAERGDLQVFQRKLAEAAEDFERSLKINPRYGPALRGAGYCKLEKREFEAAIKYLEQSITAQPEHANVYLLLGIAYLELDRREQSRAALVKALSFNTARELRAHIYLGNLFARERMYKEAAEELRKYLEANPADPAAADLKAVEAQWRARAATP
ncbi:MAG TPA: tetratricopeptide repeat protein [Pyrinomonadaceae bacterium]